MTRRIPALDGVRGLAILLVMYHHFVQGYGLDRAHRLDHWIWLTSDASWVGVDLFFVLSGFLITGILFDSKGTDGYFRTFYGRRTLRIFPLYFGFLAAAVFLWPLIVGQPLFGSDASSPVWLLTYTSNVDVALHGWREPLALGHLWSLAVEEQFYLLWPLFVLALDRRTLTQITLACFGLALAFRLVAPAYLDLLSTYVLMPARMDSLAAGAFVALAVRGQRGWKAVRIASLPMLFVSVAVLVAIAFWQKRFTPHLFPVMTLGFMALASGGAALIGYLVTAPEESWLRRGFEARWLAFLGTYSYGLYVFHQPVVRAMGALDVRLAGIPRLGVSQILGVTAFSAVALAVSIALAMISYHFWERPFLKLKRRLPYGTRPFFGPAPNSAGRPLSFDRGLRRRAPAARPLLLPAPSQEIQEIAEPRAPEGGDRPEAH